MTKKRKITMLLVAIAIIFSCFLTCFAPTTIQSVSASSIDVSGGYSSALEDLQTDDTFDETQYPVVQDDYSLQVITIAESNENELFVYVYQPSAEYTKFKATSINISTAIGQDLSFNNYKLRYVNHNGVFYKYVIQNFKIKTDLIRYYEISSIFREWYEEFDEDVDKETDNSIDEVSYVVGQQYKFNTNAETGEISMSLQDVETIKVTDKFVGYIRYTNGYIWCMSYCNAYYVAFVTDKPIDNLLEADIFYMEQEYTTTTNIILGSSTSYDDPVEKYAYLKYSDVAHNPTTGLFGQDESWQRIVDVDTFIAEEDLTDETIDNLQGLEWVLRFTETEVLESPSTNGTSMDNGHIVTDVTILRLAFITDGVYYNLGVVDNKQTGSLEPTNNLVDDRMKIILAILLLIVLLIVLAPILPTIFSVLFAIIKILLKVIIWVITAPFKLIKAIFKKRE